MAPRAVDDAVLEHHLRAALREDGCLALGLVRAAMCTHRETVDLDDRVGRDEGLLARFVQRDVREARVRARAEIEQRARRPDERRLLELELGVLDGDRALVSAREDRGSNADVRAIPHEEGPHARARLDLEVGEAERRSGALGPDRLRAAFDADQVGVEPSARIRHDRLASRAHDDSLEAPLRLGPCETQGGLTAHGEIMERAAPLDRDRALDLEERERAALPHAKRTDEACLDAAAAAHAHSLDHRLRSGVGARTEHDRRAFGRDGQGSVEAAERVRARAVASAAHRDVQRPRAGALGLTRTRDGLDPTHAEVGGDTELEHAEGARARRARTERGIDARVRRDGDDATWSRISGAVARRADTEGPCEAECEEAERSGDRDRRA
jgi:hypothetical protein